MQEKQTESLVPDAGLQQESGNWYHQAAGAVLAGGAALVAGAGDAVGGEVIHFPLNTKVAPDAGPTEQQTLYFDLTTGFTQHGAVNGSMVGSGGATFGPPQAQFGLIRVGKSWMGLYAKGPRDQGGVNNQVMASTFPWDPGWLMYPLKLNPGDTVGQGQHGNFHASPPRTYGGPFATTSPYFGKTGDVIPSGVNVQTMHASWGGNWASGDHAFLGLRFAADSSSSLGSGDASALAAAVDLDDPANFHYAWVELGLELDSEGVMQMTLYRMAYNDVPGEALTIPSPIPEPSGIALLTLGAAGMAAYRARRKKRAEASSPTTSA